MILTCAFCAHVDTIDGTADKIGHSKKPQLQLADMWCSDVTHAVITRSVTTWASLLGAPGLTTRGKDATRGRQFHGANVDAARPQPPRLNDR